MLYRSIYVNTLKNYINLIISPLTASIVGETLGQKKQGSIHLPRDNFSGFSDSLAAHHLLSMLLKITEYGAGQPWLVKEALRFCHSPRAIELSLSYDIRDGLITFPSVLARK